MFCWHAINMGGAGKLPMAGLHPLLHRRGVPATARNLNTPGKRVQRPTALPR